MSAKMKLDGRLKIRANPARPGYWRAAKKRRRVSAVVLRPDYVKSVQKIRESAEAFNRSRDGMSARQEQGR